MLSQDGYKEYWKNVYVTKRCQGFEAKGQRNIHVLLMKGYIDTTTLENNWATLSKGEDALWSRNSIPKYIIQKNCKIYTPEDMNRNIYSSAVCKEKKIQPKCRSRAKWINTWDITPKDNMN